MGRGRFPGATCHHGAGDPHDNACCQTDASRQTDANCQKDFRAAGLESPL